MRKLTKRERRALNPRVTAAVAYSLKNGDSHRVAGANYAGKPPVYVAMHDDWGVFIGYRKAVKGVPFVALQ